MVAKCNMSSDDPETEPLGLVTPIDNVFVATLFFNKSYSASHGHSTNLVPDKIVEHVLDMEVGSFVIPWTGTFEVTSENISSNYMNVKFQGKSIGTGIITTVTKGGAVSITATCNHRNSYSPCTLTCSPASPCKIIIKSQKNMYN
jgi:hypothetical protein